MPIAAINLRYCLVPKSKEMTAAIIGDSHAEDKYYGLVDQDKKRAWGLFGNSSCAPLLGTSLNSDVKDCDKRMEAVAEYVASNAAIQTVILSFYGSPFLPPLIDDLARGVPANEADVNKIYDPRQPSLPESKLKLGLHNMISKLEARAKQVIVFIDVPELPHEPRDCFRNELKNSCNQRRMSVERRQSRSRAILQSLKLEHPKLWVYDPLNTFCNAETCGYSEGGRILYRDSHHISLRGSEKFASDFLTWEASVAR